MSDKVHAIVTRKRGINGRYKDREVILDMPAGQFADWQAIGWVDRATAAQVDAARAAAAKAAAAEEQRERKGAAKAAKSPAAKPA